MRKLSALFNFPDYGVRNIRLYYLLSIFHNGWFIMGNWLFFWLKFMTIAEVGLYDAIVFGIAMLVEIPTGAVADLIGKRKTLIFSRILCIIGILTMAVGIDKYAMLWGNLIFWIGLAFYSGTAEALAYDSLVEKKKESYFDIIAAKSGFILLITAVITTGVGGFLYSINDRLPWYIMAVFNFIALLISFMFKEPKVDTEKFSLVNYFKQMLIGFQELLTPKLRRFFLVFFVLIGVYAMYDDGFIRPTIWASFGFNGEEQSYLYAVGTILGALAVGFLPALRKVFSDKVGLLLLLGVMAMSFLGASQQIGKNEGLIVLALLAITGNLAGPWISIVVNKNIDSKYRATTLSTLAFFTKLPYVAIAIFAGNLALGGNLAEFNLLTAIFIGGILIISAIWLYRK